MIFMVEGGWENKKWNIVKIHIQYQQTSKQTYGWTLE